jgi:hypothetical protein
MTDLGRSISTAADFSRVAVYRRVEETGPVYAVSFKNLEWVNKFRWQTVAGVATLALALPASIVGIEYGAAIGIPWYVIVVIALAVVSAVYRKCTNPFVVDRVIELDYGRHWLRAPGADGAEVMQQLELLRKLTVEPHPQAEFRRQERMERGEKGLKPEEKQHCLFGWFGAEGAQKVLLVSRYEWPSQDSLFEVRQAIRFARKHANSMGAGGTAERTGAAGGGAGAEDMTPPLD